MISLPVRSAQRYAWLLGAAPMILLTAACAGKSPESACSSASAQGPLKQIVLDSTAFVDPKLRAIATNGQLALENAVVQSYDEATGNATCTGVLSFKLPDAVTSNGGRDLKSGVIYEAKAAADGGGWVYSSPGIQLSWLVAYLGTIRYADGRQLAQSVPNSAVGGEIARQLREDAYKPSVLRPHDPPTQPPIARPVMDENSRTFTQAEQRLADAFLEADGQCRMGEGPDPDAVCRRSDVLLARMNTEGLCWGRADEPRAEYTVHRCGRRSIR